MTIFDNLPDSILKKVVLEKIEPQSSRFVSFCNLLSSFRDDIIQELGQINVLFSEYTPHDEENHIVNLFKISDIIIGKDEYERMNAVELCLLIGAIYAHDWGMAVSRAERYYIASQRIQEGAPEITLLDDEFDRFGQFIKKKLGQTEFESDEEIDIDTWKEYVRNTHALRSGKRVKNYFQAFDGSVAGALDKICVGHWLEIEDVSDRNGYYRDAAIFGETVNLKALTIYIRMVDLFDLAEDRTPYVLWKYVNPQNYYSKMEWEKHRALHQITCSEYENGRIICISGSTDNHEVYAALMDFKKLCEKYFREDIDALAHMNDARHKLDVYLLDWRIEAQNFKPIEIGFSFDRENVFKILSDQIYNCHPYVYIRELIQNSIDAINLRKEILNRKGIGGDNLGIVYFEVSKISEEEIVVVCQDDGIGMDEYILKNYFSVIGKSYYNSIDFNNLGVDMTVISKFGVGILSCFSVASSMEIITKREPYIEEGKQGLRVIINDMKKTFRVEEIPDYRCDVGTRIRLTIKEKELREQLKNNKIEDDYSIIGYLEKINKYIEYPIIVQEFDRKMIFLPKNYDEEKLKRKLVNYTDYEIYNVTINYPIENNILVQDLEFFNSTFEIRDINIKTDLEMEEIEGNILFPILKDERTKIEGLVGDYLITSILVDEKNRIRWKDNRFGSENYIFMCNKGILLETGKYVPYSFEFESGLFPTVLVCINFPRTISNISLSRFDYSNSREAIEKLWVRLHDYISKELLERKKEWSKYEFWRMIAMYALQYRLDIEKLNQSLFEDAEYPFINEAGEEEYTYITDKRTIKLTPFGVERIIDEYVERGRCKTCTDWSYGNCLLAKSEMHYTNSSLGEMINSVIYKSLRNKFYLKELTFVRDERHNYYLAQEIWEKGNRTDYVIEQIEEIIKDFDVVSDRDKKNIRRIYADFLNFKRCIGYADEFSQYFGYCFHILNLRHSYTHLLIKYIWCLEDMGNKNVIDKIIIERKKDALKEMPFFKTGYTIGEKKYSFSKINETLQDLHKWLREFYPQLGDEYIILGYANFIEGTIKTENQDLFSENRMYNYWE